ncbi:15331_t:CDS:1, partial [Racocetra fulgida]
MDDDFNLLKERYANWPCPIDKAVINNALAEFHESVNCDSLGELSCAIYSGLFLCKNLDIIATKEMCLSLLEINKEMKNLLCETDFAYGHQYIDESGYKILLDRGGFVKKNAKNNPFDIQKK